MKIAAIQPAIASEPLYAKSRLYIERALARKSEQNLDEYQLWASLALELLGKAALAAIHPSLVVDPTHYQSLFAAAGINLSTDIKTISAKTLFERLMHVSPRFDGDVKEFCNSIAQRRNVELHSGEAPFKLMKLDAWEARYWHACQLVLQSMTLSLEQWVGADKATAPKQILEESAAALRAAVAIRIERAAERFSDRKPKERSELLKAAEDKAPSEHAGVFSWVYDAEWNETCPSCEGKAVVAGMQIHEEIIGDPVDYGDSLWEPVERIFGAEEFHCPVCELELNGYGEIEAAGVGTEHTAEDEREMRWEPDYGND